ncbi:Glycosyl hydrolase family 1, partial [Phytophthora infestans]
LSAGALLSPPMAAASAHTLPPKTFLLSRRSPSWVVPNCANVDDDFFHRYKDDINTMKSDGYGSMRFSISWSRVMHWSSTLQRMQPNRDGLAFYHSLDWALVDAFPLGDARQAVFAGDFLNFTILKDYAELILTEFGQKVKFWSTINEPLSYMYIFYIFAVTDSDEYEAALNLLLAHAEMVALFRNLQNQGSVPLRIRYSYDATVPSVVRRVLGPINVTACTAAKWYANSATTGCFETEPEDKKRLKYL